MRLKGCDIISSVAASRATAIRPSSEAIFYRTGKMYSSGLPIETALLHTLWCSDPPAFQFSNIFLHDVDIGLRALRAFASARCPSFRLFEHQLLEPIKLRQLLPDQFVGDTRVLPRSMHRRGSG